MELSELQEWSWEVGWPDPLEFRNIWGFFFLAEKRSQVQIPHGGSEWVKTGKVGREDLESAKDRTAPLERKTHQCCESLRKVRREEEEEEEVEEEEEEEEEVEGDLVKGFEEILSVKGSLSLSLVTGRIVFRG